MAIELEQARREWAEERGIVTQLADFYTQGDIHHEAGIPNAWIIPYWDLDAEDRFDSPETDRRQIRQELRDADAIKPDGERGLLRVDVMVRILHVLRSSDYPLAKKEIVDSVISLLHPEDNHAVDKTSMWRYLKTLIELGFIRSDGTNRRTVYCAGGAKPLRNPPERKRETIERER